MKFREQFILWSLGCFHAAEFMGSWKAAGRRLPAQEWVSVDAAAFGPCEDAKPIQVLHLVLCLSAFS